ncbi:MAG: NAD-binding protein [Thermoplasmata archaeon]
MGRGRLFRNIIKASPAAKWMKESYQLKVALVILVILISSAFVYSSAEDVPIHEGFFVSMILLFGEAADPVTNIGRVSVILTMITGLIFFALIIGEVSSYLIERILRRGKLKVIKYFSGTAHIVICGKSDKLDGIMSELRSEDLETISPVIIISPNAGNISFNDQKLRHKTYGIVGDPLDSEVLENANLAQARSVLVLSTDESIKGEERYRDAHVTLMYNTIYNFLSNNDVVKDGKEDMNVVLEFLDEEMNLLPCATGEANRPEIYTTIIPGTARRLIVEPIYLENMPRYLFIQSVLERDISTIVNELLSTSLPDTSEFYYREVTGNLLGKTFNGIEVALLGTGVTAIGVLRRSQAMVDMAISGYQGARRVELFLNPESDMVLAKEDTLVLISYDAKEVTRAFSDLSPGKFSRPKPLLNNAKASQELPFKRMVIINWNRSLIRDILTEMAKIRANLNGNKDSMDKLEVVLLNGHPSDSAELEKLKNNVSEKVGRPMDELISLSTVPIGDSLTLSSLKNVGITRENAKNTRVLIVSEGGASKESDLQTLHQLQMVENRISENIFTAVELLDSKSQHYFMNTRADVIVSIDAFAEHLMAQAVLKPHISLIFRDLLTFSEDTCEFYFRDVPEPFIGKSYGELQVSLVGHPVILIGHTRPVQEEKRLHTRNSVTLNPKISGEYDDLGRQPRIMKSELLKKGDRIILIARVPEVVDSVLGQMK